jgi:hypothetical protein
MGERAPRRGSGDAMAERDMSERELRELAYAHRGELVPGSGIPVEARRLDQVVSLRLAPEIIADLRDLADRRGVTVSDLLREGAATVLMAARHTTLSKVSFVVTVSAQTSTSDGRQHSVNPTDLDAPQSVTAA